MTHLFIVLCIAILLAPTVTFGRPEAVLRDEMAAGEAAMKAVLEKLKQVQQQAGQTPESKSTGGAGGILGVPYDEAKPPVRR